MSALLTDPDVVLVVGDRDEGADALRSVVLEGRARTVETVADAGDAAERVADADDVGCVVATDDADPVAVCEAVHGVDSLCPVVAVLEDGSEEIASAVTTAGGFAYLPVAPDDDLVRDVVDDAIETYRRRRGRAADASILETVLEDAGVALYAKDTDGRYVRSAKVPGGRNPELLRGQTDLDIFGDEDPEGARRTYEDDLEVVESNEPIFRQRERLQLETGDHYSQTTKVPWVDDGEVRGLVGISLDVTDFVNQERRLERQKERIDEFAEYVSHDLRGPLQVATGALDLARETGEEDAFDKVEDALDRIDEMIEDLSALAREGQAITRFEIDESEFLKADVEDTTPLVPLVHEVWKLVRHEDARLSVEFPDDALVVAPEASVRPLLENLFKNAVVHAGPAVHVRIGPIDGGGFYVEDDGPGIPPDERSDVFEHGYTTSEEGSGTGLHIVSRVADRHTWDLEVTEGSEGGARFEVRNCLFVDDPGQSVDGGETVQLTDSTDVGDVEIPGEADYDEVVDRWTLSGAGRNIWRQINEFHFAHAEVEGPVRIQGRIVELDDLKEYTKAGVMVRDDLTEDAGYGYVGVTPQHGSELLWRTRRGADGVSQHVEEMSLSFPWYRIDRVGGRVTTWLSADGEDWLPIDQRVVELDDTVSVGLVVCSFTPNRLCEAVFEDVTVMKPDR